MFRMLRLTGQSCVCEGKDYELDITKASNRLARATPEQRGNFEVSPAGYGVHWPDVDEDLSIDGLIGIKHPCPLGQAEGPMDRWTLATS